MTCIGFQDRRIQPLCHSSVFYLTWQVHSYLARPLAGLLRDEGYRVWYDEFSLTVGDSLRSSIDKGLAESDFGVVILSKSFFEKTWPQQELNGLASKETHGNKVILPVWHQVVWRQLLLLISDNYFSPSTTTTTLTNL